MDILYGRDPRSFRSLVPTAPTKHAIEAVAGSMKAELEQFGIKVATVNPGVFGTGFNDTGAESYVQWHDAETAHVPMPDFGPSLADQADPQEMVDAMVETIVSNDPDYRTMRPLETIDAAKQWQETEWTAEGLRQSRRKESI